MLNHDGVIKAVMFREGDWWVAQCLDVDIAGQARNERDLYYELGRLLVGRIMAAGKLGVDPFATLPPAPRRYWDMFDRAQTQEKTIFSFMPATDPAMMRVPELAMKSVF